MTAISVGAKAPDFALKDQNGTLLQSVDLRGKNVLLSFHPLAWTGVCQRQMESLEMNAAVFAKLNTAAFGVSVDAPPSKKAWEKSMHVKETLLLSDFWPHGGLAKALGVFKEDAGVSLRANILLDPKGVVVWVKIYPAEDVPNPEEVIAALREMNSQSTNR